MPEIPEPNRYLPDRNALNTWLYTRKADKLYGMESPPGFFFTFNYPKDLGFTIAALVMELTGVLLFIVNGMLLGDSLFATIAILGSIALAVVDVLLAYWLHRNHHLKCLGRFQLRIVRNPRTMAVIRDDLKKGWGLDLLIRGGIITIALVKIGGIVLLGTFDHVALYVALFIMFGFIVYVHFVHTGYAIYGYFTNRTFRRQLGKLNRGEEAFAVKPGNHFRHYFESNVDLFDGAGQAQELGARTRHKIKRVNPKQGSKEPHAYEIVSQGILMDRDIDEFIQQNGLRTDQITTITNEFLKLQLIQYNQAQYNNLLEQGAFYPN